jgi:hypothetical protein
MMPAVIAFWSDQESIRLQIRRDELSVPAGVVGLGCQEDDIKDLMHRGELAQVMRPHLGVNLSLPESHPKAVGAHRLNVSGPLINDPTSSPAFVRSAATQLPFAPVPRSIRVFSLLMTFPGAAVESPAHYSGF